MKIVWFAAVEKAPSRHDAQPSSLRKILMSTFRFPLKLSWLVFIAAFPAGIGAPLNIARAQNFVPLKDSVPSITTTGIASTEVAPDIATISLGVNTERPNAANAARDNARAAQAMIDEIKAQGIEARDTK